MDAIRRKLGIFPHDNAIGIPKTRIHNLKKSPKIIGEIAALCRSIIRNCEQDDLETVLAKIDGVKIKLDEIDDDIMFEGGNSTMREMISVLQMVQQANKIAVAKSIMMSHSSE